jgi:hypothetical protein
MAGKTKIRIHRTKKMTIPLAIVAGALPLATDVWNHRDNLEAMSYTAVKDLTGYKLPGRYGDGQFNFSETKKGLLPILAGMAIHKVVGGYFGLNRLLGSMGIPVVRI